MPIKFILDSRERFLRTLFSARDIPFEDRTLELGDILILYSKDEIPTVKASNMSNSSKCLLGLPSGKDEVTSVESTVQTFTIERKTYTDLDGSIKDGRYHEQKSRYSQLPRGTVYYILENNDPAFNRLGRDQYLGMYVHTMVRDDIGVFHTESLEDTFDTIIKISETLERFEGFNPRIVGAPRVEETQIKKKKAKGKEVYRQQLCCFPGISGTKADLIVTVYPDMSSLMKAIQNETFKVKGIGPVLLAGMKEGLWRSETTKAPARGTAAIVFDD